MNENTSDPGGQERRVGPTVSRDKWLLHARQKLARGYVLIVARDGKRRANFWLAEKGYEMCAFDVARHLVATGEVVHTGEHPLGHLYTPGATPPPPPAKPSRSSKPKAAPRPVPAVAPVEVAEVEVPEAELVAALPDETAEPS